MPRKRLRCLPPPFSKESCHEQGTPPQLHELRSHSSCRTFLRLADLTPLQYGAPDIYLARLAMSNQDDPSPSHFACMRAVPRECVAHFLHKTDKIHLFAPPY